MSIISESEGVATMTINHYERILRELDEAREELKHITEYGTDEINAAVELRQKLASVLVERDDARKEVEFLKKTPLRQRCQQLERLSDHWCDMHTVAAKGRDEAREEAAHWKAEYEIVEARLCGWKHPRDNGIIFEHEVIPGLEAKIAQLGGKTAKPEPSWYNQREIPIANEEETK